MKHRAPVLAIIAAAFIVYWPVYRYDFIRWDDMINIYQNKNYLPVTWEKLLSLWTAPFASFYIPVTSTVWAILAWLTQQFVSPVATYPISPVLFHSANLVVHVLNSILVYAVLNLILQRHLASTVTHHDLRLPSLLGALLFALHPVQAEPVSWASGMRDLLCGFWSLFCLWQYLRFAESGRRVFYFASSVAFLLAVLSKPSAAVIPLVAAVLQLSLFAAPGRRVLLCLAPWVVTSAVIGYMTFAIQRTEFTYVVPLLSRPLIALDAYGFYIRKLVFPFLLCATYPNQPAEVLKTHSYLLSLWVPFVVLAALWFTKLRIKTVTVGILIFFISLLPVSGLTSFISQNQSTVFDRYLYLPMLGPAFVLAAFSESHWRSKRGIITLAGLALLGLASSFQTRVWADTYSLFSHALRVNPENDTSHYNLWLYFKEKGLPSEAEQHRQAAIHQQMEKANTAVQSSDMSEAIVRYDSVLTLDPENVTALTNSGIAHAIQGQMDKAIGDFTQALTLRPDHLEALANLGNAYRLSGQPRKAIENYRKALALEPELPHVRTALEILEQEIARKGGV